MLRALVECNVSELETALAGEGFKPSHARRVLRLFYGSAGVTDFSGDESPSQLRPVLAQAAAFGTRVRHRHTSSDGTIKLLVQLADGHNIEAVLLSSNRPGVAAGCLSSQVGCAVGCDFCASTRNGLARNLHFSEIVEQFIHLKRLAIDTGRRLNTIVFMGMGEPLLNLDNVLPAIERIAHPDLGGIGWRHVTVSTVGIVPGIDRLAEADLNVHLALSLHAPDDETRGRIVPPNRKYPVAQIVAAAKRYYARTRRIVTIEYCLLAGVNDSDEQARLLARLLEGFRVHVNLIPFNAIGAGVSGIVYERPSDERISRFLEILRSEGTVAHVRQTRGDDVSGACGQLQAQRVLT